MDAYLSQGYLHYVKCKKASSRIWTRVVMIISYDGNHYTKSSLCLPSECSRSKEGHHQAYWKALVWVMVTIVGTGHGNSNYPKILSPAMDK